MISAILFHSIIHSKYVKMFHTYILKTYLWRIYSSTEAVFTCSFFLYELLLLQIWSVTTGALLDTLSGSDSPVTSVLLYHGFVLSASKAAASVRLWSLKYDPRHKPTATIPAGCAHVAVTEDADRVFYVRQQSQTTVLSWNNNTGHCKERDVHVCAPVCTCLFNSTTLSSMVHVQVM